MSNTEQPDQTKDKDGDGHSENGHRSPPPSSKKANSKKEKTMSVHSTKSTTSVIRKKRIAVNGRKDLDKLVEEEDELEVLLEKKQRALKSVAEKLRQKQEELADPNLSDDQKMEISDQVKTLKHEQSEKLDDLEDFEIDLKAKLKSIKRKRAKIQEEIELAEMEADFEDDGDSFDITPPGSDKVRNWEAANSQYQGTKSAPYSFNGDQFGSNKHEVQDTAERIKVQTVSPPNQSPGQPVSDLQPIAVPFVPRDRTDQFIARQSHSKDLPYFSGQPEEWLKFKSAYERTTRICGFSNDENLTRLEKCLKGDAMKLTMSLMTTPDNVEAIIKKLEKRFGQPGFIIRSMILKVRNAASVKSEQLESLIEFGCTVDNLVTTLKALNRRDHLFNPMLLEDLEGKLPVSMKMSWRKWLLSDPIRIKGIESFASWLELNTDIACELCPPKLSIKEDKPRDRDQRQKNRGHGEKVFIATEQDDEKKKDADGLADQKKDKPCRFCSNLGHKLQSCHKFRKTDISKRYGWVKEQRLCFRCLNFGHGIGDCKSKETCGQNGCKSKHHPLLHSETKQKEQPRYKEDPKPKEEPEPPEEETKTILMSSSPKIEEKCEVVYLMTEVTLRGPKGEMDAFLVIDPCSSASVLDHKVDKALGLKGRKAPFNFEGLGYKGSREDSRLVGFTVVSKYNRIAYPIENIHTDEVNYLPVQSLRKDDLKKWKQFDGIPFKSYSNAKPVLLLGIPHAHLFRPFRSVGPGGKNVPYAIETPLGWLLSGNLPENGNKSRKEKIFLLQEPEDRLHEIVKAHWTIEDFGVRIPQENPRSSDDKRAEEIFESTTRRVGEKFEMGLLWNSANPSFPESYNNAFSRLQSMERKMDRDEEFGKVYEAKIEEYLQKGFCRKLKKEEEIIQNSRTYYLPHFGVTNPNKPGKFRLVFDAAAKSHGVSMNDRLLKGPDYVPPLPAVLFRFRQKAVGFTADIADMFHMVQIRKEDQDAQRFLWRGSDRHRPPDTYVMQCMIFGAASSPSCAQYVKNRNAQEVGQDCPEALDDIVRNHYVDDYPGCTDTEEEGIRRFKDVTRIHKQGGFHICKWISNSRAFNEAVPEELRATGIRSMDMDSSSETERVLGLHWDPSADVFTFKTAFHKVKKEIVSGEKVPTKREALALIMSVYDPLGFLSLLTINAKILLQETWRTGIGWDDEIPSSLFPKWVQWLHDLHKITSFRVPRCYSPFFSKSDKIQLHIFVDASEVAFASVAYFRIENEEQVHVALVAGKSKVAPLKPLSIPRMELQAAVMGSRLARCIKTEHDVKIEKTFYWSDSKTVLCWLRADGRKFQQFVSHRIGEIQELSDVADWQWVPTKENVADEATREKNADFDPDSRWVNGPSFLKLSQDEWPIEANRNEDLRPAYMEFKKEFIALVSKKPKVLCPIDITRFSRWTRLIGATAAVLKVVRKCQNLSAEDNRTVWQQAQDKWCQWSQADTYGDELEAISNKKEVSPNSPIAKLCPFIDDDGILRMISRIPEGAENFAMEKNPILLHPKHPYTVLLIRHFHEKAGHHGFERVINDIRQKYCITKVRAAVKKAWKECLVCQMKKVKPSQPQMGELPLARLQSYVSPFHQTGVDYFGPMEVTVGRRREKRYGCLFTCMTSRAVHLEIATSLSTDSFLMALRRFIARRGCPRDIFSDNGTNFVGANNELKKKLMELEQVKIEGEMSTRGIRWHFIPPAAPHMGGSWERLVKAVKVALAATLKTRAPRDEVLQTLMTEAEHTVNARPLTYVSCDPNDPESLTPNHFLIGRSSDLPAWRKMEIKENPCLRQQWEQASHLADLFWKRWVTEYLPNLTGRQKWQNPGKPIEPGDVVILCDNTQPRDHWQKGIILKTFPGRDGQVRKVEVKTEKGTFIRPAVKICVLNVKGPEEDKTDDSSATRPEEDKAGDIGMG